MPKTRRNCEASPDRSSLTRISPRRAPLGLPDLLNATSLALSTAKTALKVTNSSDVPRIVYPASIFGSTVVMELAVAPPHRMAVGASFDPPLVIVFNKSGLKEGAVQPNIDLSGVWAFLSVITEDKSRSLAPPRTDLIRGQPAASIRPLSQQALTEGPMFAYAAFPDLAITRRGRYRFKINIVDMNNSYCDGPWRRAARLLPALYTQCFDVVDNAQSMSLADSKNKRLYERLQTLGVRV